MFAPPPYDEEENIPPWIQQYQQQQQQEGLDLNGISLVERDTIYWNTKEVENRFADHRQLLHSS